MSLRVMTMIWAAGLASAAAAETTPYAGQQTRAVASLSVQDVDDLLAGRGWGFAKPAELNGYPGPSHVLALAGELGLSAEQTGQVQTIFDAMQVRAQVLGADYVAAEAALDESFASGAITPADLTDLTAQAAEIAAELRAAHLAAHLETLPVLTRHQIMTYNTLRGYGDENAGHDHN